MSQRRKTSEHVVLEYLRQIMSELPSDVQKRQLVDNLELIKKHIEDLKRRIESIPDDPSKTRVVTAIETINDFLSSAKDNPPVAAALGLPYKRTSGTTTRKVGDPRVGERLFNELGSLPSDQILRRLLDYKAVSMADLRALAIHVGIKQKERASRTDLADQIVKLGFANVRGYERLRSPNGVRT